MPKVRGFLKLLVVLLCMNSAAAQTFQKLYNGQKFSTGYLFQEADSGFSLLSTNELTNTPTNDFRILKTNNYGDSIGVIYINIRGYYSNMCYTNSKHQFALLSLTYSNGLVADSLLLSRYDWNGNLISCWSYFIDSLGIGGVITETSDKGYIIGGGFESTSNTTYTRFMKLDSLGNIVWKKSALSSPDYLSVHDIVETKNKRFVAEISEYAGSNISIAGYNLVQFDSLGNVEWISDVTHGQAAYSNQLAQCDSGFFFLLIDGDSNWQITNSNLCFVDTAGVLQWQRMFYDPLSYYSQVKCNANGTISLFGGTRTYTNSHIDILLTTLNNNHDSISSSVLGFSQKRELTSFINRLSNGGWGIIGSCPIPLIGGNKTFFIASDFVGNVLTTSNPNSFLVSKNFKIQPNPSSSFFTLSFNSDDPVSFIISDAMGNEIRKGKVTHPNFSFGDDLTSGIYFLHLSSPQQNQTLKLIKTN